MNSEDKINELKTGIGATVEVSWMFFSASLKAGFRPEYALELTKTFLQTMMMTSLSKGGPKDD